MRKKYEVQSIFPFISPFNTFDTSFINFKGIEMHKNKVYWIRNKKKIAVEDNNNETFHDLIGHVLMSQK